jgi:hypothetical protein
MGKKKSAKLKEKRLQQLQQDGIESLGKTKARCCKKYKKAETKRCKKCPCFDLLKKVA